MARKLAEKLASKMLVNAGEKMHRRPGVTMHHGGGEHRGAKPAFQFD